MSFYIMVKILVVDKSGQINETKLNSFEKLHIKCKYRSKKNFEKRHTWKIGDKWISVYAKDDGKAGNENKYDFPPPIDTDLFYGSIAVLMHNKEDISADILCDLTKQSWKKIYDELFGGFEDIEDDEESDEEYISPEDSTKEGYEKDGFVVDDDESLGEEENYDNESEFSASEDDTTDSEYNDSELSEEEYE